MNESNRVCYYKVLDIDREADLDKVRKAYRKQSLKWHPDKNIENKDEAEQKFKSISEAYQVLSDSKKRRDYDRYGFSEDSRQTQEQSMPEYHFRSSNDIFQEFFGRDPFDNFFSGSGTSSSNFFSPFSSFPGFPSFTGFGNFSAHTFSRQSPFNDPFFNDPFFNDPFDHPFFRNQMRPQPMFNPQHGFLNGPSGFPRFPEFRGLPTHSNSSRVSSSSTFSYTDRSGVTHTTHQTFGPSGQQSSTARRVGIIRPSNNHQQPNFPRRGDKYFEARHHTNTRNYRPY